MSAHNIVASFHPLAALFPEVEGEDFAGLCRSIEADGQLERITIHEGMVLDGRARYRACIATGLEPETRPLPWGMDPLEYLMAENLHRRHLSTGQRAMVAARLATMRQGERTDLASNKATSQTEAAERMNVGRSSVQQAKMVQDSGNDALVDAVERNLIPVHLAARVSRLPAEAQAAVLAAPADRVATTIKRLARDQRESDLSDRIEAEAERLGTMRHYGVMLADPPWRFEPWSPSGMDRAADNHYPTMTLDRLIAIEPPAATDCILFLWATVPMMPHALEVMASWGFDYKSLFVWEKPGIGTGYWNRNNAELLLLGTRGQIPAPAPGTQFPTIIAAPTGGHSAKPTEFHEVVEAYFPNVRRLEMFARKGGELRPGWDYWGGELAAEPAETL